MLEVGYGSVKKMARALCERSRASLVIGKVTLPLQGPEDLLTAVERQMPLTTRLAVFDYVTSNTAMRMPIEELSSLCRKRGVEVLVDGAHSLGMMPLDVPSLGADYFVANCHKWLCAPRGSALLWVSPDKQQCVKALTVSHGADHGFNSQFIWDGNRDYSPYLALPLVLAFWRALGTDRVYAHMRQLADAAADLLASRWGTESLLPSSLTCDAMRLVRLPEGVTGQPLGGTAAKRVQDVLHFKYKVEVPVKRIQDRLYVRLSVHIYNTEEDYRRLMDAVCDMAQLDEQT
eukprot:evm.model.scf_3648.1 EVM.evm.TU.scf_3648.1   scf_3648:1219-5713(-)